MSELFAVCRHSRGGFHVWPLERVVKMNLEKALRGVPLNDEWHPLAVKETLQEALVEERELKRKLRNRRETLATMGVDYPEAERTLDGDGEEQP
jgi:hypothetical protein